MKPKLRAVKALSQTVGHKGAAGSPTFRSILPVRREVPISEAPCSSYNARGKELRASPSLPCRSLMEDCFSLIVISYGAQLMVCVLFWFVCALRTSAMCMPCAPFHSHQPVTGEKLDGDYYEVLLFQAHRSVIGESCGTHAGPAIRQSLLL